MLPSIVPVLKGSNEELPVAEDKVELSLREAITRRYTGGRGRRKTDLKLKAKIMQLRGVSRI